MAEQGKEKNEFDGYEKWPVIHDNTVINDLKVIYYKGCEKKSAILEKLLIIMQFNNGLASLCKRFAQSSYTHRSKLSTCPGNIVILHPITCAV